MSEVLIAYIILSPSFLTEPQILAGYVAAFNKNSFSYPTLLWDVDICNGQ